MANTQHVTVEQYDTGSPDRHNYYVVRLVNRLTPQIGKFVTVEEIHDLIDMGCKVTIIPPK